MILVRIFAPWTKDQVRRNPLLQFFEHGLDFGSDIGHESIRKSLQQGLL